MPDGVRLTLRAPVAGGFEVQGVTADGLAGRSEREIATLPAWVGRQRVPLGDLFHVRSAPVPLVHVEGDLGAVDGLGEGQTAGRLVIDGSAGARTAAQMLGGEVEVRGRVGHDAGLAMGGGTLLVHGQAGDRLGAAEPGTSSGMRGGTIQVLGSAGTDAGAALRRGLVVIGGDLGAQAGRQMRAGTLVAFGRIAGGAGWGNRRGSIVALGGLDVPSTYREACTFEPVFLRLLLVGLARAGRLPVTQSMIDGRYRRFCGDLLPPGKGEILQWTGR